MADLSFVRYNMLLAAVIVAGMVFCSAFNWLVDPYGVWQAPSIDRFNADKVRQEDHVRLFKAVKVTRLRPKVVFLGSSRIEFGLNPAHPYFARQRPVYNLGISGSNMRENLAYLRHALHNQPKLRTVVIGLDFFGFSKASHEDIKGDFLPARLERRGVIFQDAMAVLFSLDALRDSLATVRHSYLDPGVHPFDDLGMFTETAKLADLQRRPLPFQFRQSLKLYLHHRNRFAGFVLSDAALEDFRSLVTLCRERGIRLYPFISPTHAAHLEALSASELWPVFEDWKRRLVEIAGGVWDFSGYNTVTVEPISEDMRNYWDISHYRRGIGDLIINRMFGYREAQVPADFGRWITARNLEDHLREVNQNRAAWVAENPEVVALVRRLQRPAGSDGQARGRSLVRAD